MMTDETSINYRRRSCRSRDLMRGSHTYLDGTLTVSEHARPGCVEGIRGWSGPWRRRHYCRRSVEQRRRTCSCSCVSSALPCTGGPSDMMIVVALAWSTYS
ncbi:hypothetical protein H257_05733 [Aphanomyces astaci]|uniref:Uncharacterized protein n=1 Tax=Aphanomyces astaci TaxID=112090 RepID=W4GN92_APHAT|nr:hypothetical protein H257_05733 [Aphanomyces astaci]ETV81142.1 hypothetical protein H257_05733 [Aphanomyces astaci]|eukprot:XP_009829000.1 hypothetical protein H257_05733 [Aphanomyces astaci]